MKHQAVDRDVVLSAPSIATSCRRRSRRRHGARGLALSAVPRRRRLRLSVIRLRRDQKPPGRGFWTSGPLRTSTTCVRCAFAAVFPTTTFRTAVHWRQWARSRRKKALGLRAMGRAAEGPLRGPAGRVWRRHGVDFVDAEAPRVRPRHAAPSVMTSSPAALAALTATLAPTPTTGARGFRRRRGTCRPRQSRHFAHRRSRPSSR